MSAGDYHVVRQANGSCSVGCRETGEVMHPHIGPEIEAQSLYVEGLDLVERAKSMAEFRIWDIGMGAGANVLTAMKALIGTVARLRIVSFDHTAEALRFAAERPDDFGYLMDFETETKTLLDRGEVKFTRGDTLVEWRFLEGDFLGELRNREDAIMAPDAILFDAWSPMRNSGMWTEEVFRSIHSSLDPARPCSLATYSRATCIRAALLLVGFYVGRGRAIGAKEQSTVAANNLSLLKDPLVASWLEKAARSHSGHPLKSDKFTQEPLTEAQLDELRQHPQFKDSR